MSDSYKSLNHKELKSIFDKYDLNKDNLLDKKEVELLVMDVYKLITKKEKILADDLKVINKSVDEIMKLKDTNKDGTLQWEEFSSYMEGKNFMETTVDKIDESTRTLAYAARIGTVLKRLPAIMSYSRPLAYASEVGESFRPIIPPFAVTSLYALSWAYVIVDTCVKTYKVKEHGQEKMIYTFGDTALWHCIASMALPALTIHSIVKYSGKGFESFKNLSPKLKKFGPVGIGLSSIPLIIHPIDHITDWVFDSTLRKLYSDKLVKHHH